MQLVVGSEELYCHVCVWLMQAAHNSPAQGHGSPRKQKQAGFISRLCGRSSQTEDAHVPGKKWVQVFDHAGAKWGHVLLSSWLDTSEERTVMHQSSPPPPMMQTLMALPQQPYLPPPPSYLPPLQNTRDLGGGVVSQGKGYQQLTSWQVMVPASPAHSVWYTCAIIDLSVSDMLHILVGLCKSDAATKQNTHVDSLANHVRCWTSGSQAGVQQGYACCRYTF